MLASVARAIIVIAGLSACAREAGVAATSPRDSRVLDLAGRMLDGTEVRMSDLRGKVVLVDIWATWCAPCGYSLPVYRELYEQYRDRGFIVLGVNVDEDEAAVRDYLVDMPLPFPIMRDPTGAIPAQLDVRAMPTSFLVDRSGHVRLRHEGFKPSDGNIIRARVEALVTEPAPLFPAALSLPRIGEPRVGDEALVGEALEERA